MISPVLLEKIHKTIHDNVIEFIHSPSSVNEILLIRSPSGVGATYNTREAAFKDDNYTIWFGPHPGQLKAEIMKYVTVPYLSALNENNCVQYEQAYNFKKRGFIAQKILCKKCSARATCKYYEMINRINDSENGWCGHHNSLKNNLLNSSLIGRQKKYKVLVIDHPFLHSSIIEKRISWREMEEFINLLEKDWLPKEPPGNTRDFLQFLLAFTEVIYTTIRGKNLEGMLLIKKILSTFYKEVTPQVFEDYATRKNSEFKEIIDKYYNMIRTDIRPVVNNLLEPFLDIIRLCYRYHASAHDIILPFEIKNNLLIYRTIKIPIPQDVPIVIIDPYTPVEIYENIFNRKIKILDIFSEFSSLNKTPDNLKIYQYERGRLPKRSLHNPKIWEWLFPTIAGYLKLKPKTKHAIYLPKFFRKKLEDYLKKIKNFELYYFYDDVSKGSKSLKKINNMIIVGTPEPNSDKLITLIQMLHIGETPLDTKYNKKTHEYDDGRIQVFYNMLSKEQIRNLIYKMRPLISNSKKTILLISNIPLEEKTERLSVEDLQFRIRIKSMTTGKKIIIDKFEDGEKISDRLKEVVDNYFNKHSRKDKVPVSTIIRNFKAKTEFLKFDNSSINEILQLHYDIKGDNVHKNFIV